MTPEPGTRWEIKNNLSTLVRRLATSGPTKGSVGAKGEIVGGRGEGKTLVLKKLTCSHRLSFAKHYLFLSLILIKTLCQKFSKGRKFNIIIRQ